MSYPVAKGTPMIQSLIEWDHSVEWLVCNFAQKVNIKNINCIKLFFIKKKYWILNG